MIPRLVVITDWSLGEAALFSRLEAALGTRVPIAVQHRHPGVTTRTYFEEAQRLQARCERFGAPLFVSARLDLALALGAHLHLPAWALPPKEVRGALPKGRWISVAVHDEREARDAEGADFALVSPVFPTASKPGVAPLGAEGFARLAGQLSCPAFALGGVTAERAIGLVDVAGVAVISAVLNADDPARVVHELERSCPSAARPG